MHRLIVREQLQVVTHAVTIFTKVSVWIVVIVKERVREGNTGTITNPLISAVYGTHSFLAKERHD